MGTQKHEPTMIEAAESLIDSLYKDNDHLKEDKAFLLERCKKLERLVRDYEKFVRNLDEQRGDNVVREPKLLGLLQRTEQLVPDE